MQNECADSWLPTSFMLVPEAELARSIPDIGPAARCCQALLRLHRHDTTDDSVDASGICHRQAHRSQKPSGKDWLEAGDQMALQQPVCVCVCVCVSKHAWSAHERYRCSLDKHSWHSRCVCVCVWTKWSLQVSSTLFLSLLAVIGLMLQRLPPSKHGVCMW